jgi:hypothetical protein
MKPCSFNLIVRFVPSIATAMACIFTSCEKGACAGSTNCFFLQGFRELVKWEMSEMNSLTNGMDMSYEGDSLLFLPTNFIHGLSNEITSSGFHALIMQPRTGPQTDDDSTQFAVAIFSGNNPEAPAGAEMGFEIRANCPMRSDGAPPWVKRLEFYLTARFDGHTADFATQAIQEEAEAGVTNIELPFGFSPELKQKYWIPSRWVAEDTLDLDRIDNGIPQDKGLIKMNHLWMVKDGQFAWIYWMDFGLPCSERRDAIEYDRTYSAQFETATKEALQIIAERKVHSDIGIPLDREVQRILEQKYRIKWATPLELRNDN